MSDFVRLVDLFWFWFQVYKQKLKHVLSEQHNTETQLKTDGAAASSLVQKQHMGSELRLREDTQGLKADLREKQHQNQNCIMDLKLVRRYVREETNMQETRGPCSR